MRKCINMLQVLQSLIDSERTLVAELQKLIQNYLRPLHASGMYVVIIAL